MSTRAGSIDAGVIFQMMRPRGEFPAEAVESRSRPSQACSGSRSAAGPARRARRRWTRRRAGHGRLRGYAYRIQTGIATMATAMGGLDALSFSGGAGEASARLREDVCDGLAFLGIGPLRPAAELGGVDAVASAGGAVAVLVVTLDEDVEVGAPGSAGAAAERAPLRHRRRLSVRADAASTPARQPHATHDRLPKTGRRTMSSWADRCRRGLGSTSVVPLQRSDSGCARSAGRRAPPRDRASPPG